MNRKVSKQKEKGLQYSETVDTMYWRRMRRMESQIMLNIAACVLAGLVAYLLGSISFAVIVRMQG